MSQGFDGRGIRVQRRDRDRALRKTTCFGQTGLAASVGLSVPSYAGWSIKGRKNQCLKLVARQAGADRSPATCIGLDGFESHSSAACHPGALPLTEIVRSDRSQSVALRQGAHYSPRGNCAHPQGISGEVNQPRSGTCNSNWHACPYFPIFLSQLLGCTPGNPGRGIRDTIFPISCGHPSGF